MSRRGVPAGLVMWDSNWGLRGLPLPYGSDPSAGETWLGSREGEEVRARVAYLQGGDAGRLEWV